MSARPEKPGCRVVRRGWWNTILTLPGCTQQESHLLVYLETTHLALWTGLYPISPKDISRHTCMPVEEVLAAIDGVCRRGLIVYDGDRQLVYVRGLMLRQLGVDMPNKNQIEGLVRIIERMEEDSCAVRAFIEDHLEIPEIGELYRSFYLLPPSPPPITLPPPDGGARGEV